MSATLKAGSAAWMAVCLALFAGSPIALAQSSGGSVTATADPTTPNPVSSGQPASAALHATATPPSPPPYCTLSGPSWNWALNGTAPGQLNVTLLNPTYPNTTLSATITAPGVYTLTATATATWTDSCGDTFVASGTTTPIVITVVGVQKLQYQQPGGGYVDVSGTLYVLVGQSVTFHAVPTPNGSSFPSGQPTWSGTQGFSGSGDTVTVAFSQLSTSTTDFKTVTATCGNTSVTANVIVFDLTPIQTPRDNFAGRDLTAYGVCELVDLSYQTTPAGISDDDIGGLQWQIMSGGGTLSGGAGGINTYQCPDVGGAAVLSLGITGGPMLGLMKSADPKDVVPPDGATVLRRPDTDLWHTKDTCSCGFCGDIYATCAKAVSFKEIQVREFDCFGTATGYFKDSKMDGLKHHKSPIWYDLKDLVKDKGYQFDFDFATRKFDKLFFMSTLTPYAVGTFNWPIPHQYKKKGADDDAAKDYATANQSCDSTAEGKCTIRKAGSGDFPKDAGDDTIVPANWNDQ